MSFIDRLFGTYRELSDILVKSKDRKAASGFFINFIFDPTDIERTVAAKKIKQLELLDGFEIDGAELKNRVIYANVYFFFGNYNRLLPVCNTPITTQNRYFDDGIFPLRDGGGGEAAYSNLS